MTKCHSAPEENWIEEDIELRNRHFGKYEITTLLPIERLTPWVGLLECNTQYTIIAKAGLRKKGTWRHQPQEDVDGDQPHQDVDKRSNNMPNYYRNTGAFYIIL